MNNLVDLLKVKWTFFIEAPAISWIGAIIIALIAIGFTIWLCKLVKKEKKVLDQISKEVSNLIESRNISSKKDGLSEQDFDKLQQLSEKNPIIEPFILHIVKSSGHREDRFWSTDSAQKLITYESIVSTKINRNLFTSIPGAVTGLGLLFTFVAILIALLDVRLVNNRVQGLELLIQGLSGKFISSIAGLVAATLYLFIEKVKFQTLTKSYYQLVSTLDKFVPQLTTAKVLLDIKTDMSEQSLSFREFTTALGQSLQAGITVSMKPTLDKMVDAINELNQLMRVAKAQEQETITESLSSMLEKLQDSLNNSIERMVDSFTNSLSGNAMSQFNKVAASLEGTAELLGSMNVQFQQTQTNLNNLIKFAQELTAEQMNMGRTQVQELSSVLQKLMIQLQETAGSSVKNMSENLVSVVHKVSEDIKELEERISVNMQDRMDKTTEVANGVIQQAGKWNNDNMEKLKELLGAHQGQIDKVTGLQLLLDSSIKEFNQSLEKHKDINITLQHISREVLGTVSSIKSTATEMKAAQNLVKDVATLSKQQVEKLTEANDKQVEIWKEIQRSMQYYQHTFREVENSASSLLSEITSYLNNHVQLCKSGYEEMAKQASEQFKDATARLGSSVNDLNDHLEDLNQIFENNLPKTNGKIPATQNGGLNVRR
jgi:uncharacterized protein YoxC